MNLERKASIPVKSGGMNDNDLRRYNRPNNSGFANDPVYQAFPELRDRMETRILPGEEYTIALGKLSEEVKNYNEGAIQHLIESDSKFMRTKREEMLTRSIHSRAPVLVQDGHPWVHGAVIVNPESAYRAH